MYRLRFFFDHGSGVCLWTANDAARERLGDYPVLLEDLPLSPETVQEGEGLLTRYDTSLDRDDPGGPSPWRDEDVVAFHAAAVAFLARLRRELGPAFEIVDAWSDRYLSGLSWRGRGGGSGGSARGTGSRRGGP